MTYGATVNTDNILKASYIIKNCIQELNNRPVSPYDGPITRICVNVSHELTHALDLIEQSSSNHTTDSNTTYCGSRPCVSVEKLKQEISELLHRVNGLVER